MRIFQERGKVLSNLEVAPGVFLLRLELPQIAKAARPGQFVHLRPDSSYDPLLRRPFSIHRGQPAQAEVNILYQVVGKGTRLLSQRSTGESLDCLGPLGNGFAVPTGERQFILAAGGIGIAPLVFLAESCLKTEKPNEIAKVAFLIGAVSAEYILCERELLSWGVEVEVATDDGSLGHRGPVTDLLAGEIESLPKSGHIFSCGPEKMLKEVARMANQQEIPCQLSLEQQMACGLGACQGCVVKTRSGYRRVCVDGPVFPAGEVMFE